MEGKKDRWVKGHVIEERKKRRKEWKRKVDDLYEKDAEEGEGREG